MVLSGKEISICYVWWHDKLFALVQNSEFPSVIRILCADNCFQEAESVDDQLKRIKTYIKDLTDIIVESSKQEKQSKEVFDRLAAPGRVK